MLTFAPGPSCANRVLQSVDAVLPDLQTGIWRPADQL